MKGPAKAVRARREFFSENGDPRIEVIQAAYCQVVSYWLETYETDHVTDHVCEKHDLMEVSSKHRRSQSDSYYESIGFTWSLNNESTGATCNVLEHATISKQ